MELWTRGADQSGWTPWPDVPCGLAALTDADARTSVLLMTTEPDAEQATLAATLKLVRGLGAFPVTLASPHPASSWLEPLQRQGVDHVWVLRGRKGAEAPRAAQPIEVLQPICPHLHTSASGSRTLSVCGRHHDRLVLARHHLDAWCLHGDPDCPHLRRGGGDA